MATMAQMVEVKNVNHPGDRRKVDAGKYGAMKRAMLRVLPRRGPGLTQSEMFDRVVEVLPQTQFPGGQKAGWWMKCVQLDLEARGLVQRDRKARPLRWTRAPS